MQLGLLLAYAIVAVGLGLLTMILALAVRKGWIGLGRAWLLAWVWSTMCLAATAFALSGGQPDFFDLICFPTFGAAFLTLGMMVPFATIRRR